VGKRHRRRHRKRRPAHLADTLVDHYRITPEQARSDVAALLADLRRTT
jgi:hypothetical protein